MKKSGHKVTKTASGAKTSAAKRLALYRLKARRAGVRRIEVTVPAAGVAAIRALAHSLRGQRNKSGVEILEMLRDAGGERLGLQEPPRDRASTSAEFLEMLDRRIGDGVRLELPPRPYEEPRLTGF